MKAFTGESTEKFERRKFTSTPIEIEDALFTQQNLESFRDLLRKMFKINPKERITLLGIINHKFFDSFRKACPSLSALE